MKHTRNETNALVLIGLAVTGALLVWTLQVALGVVQLP